MGFFNFIETFFFISLGITFVLILLLVYHFKQRINSIEQKNETMFEIINNVVKELTVIRNMQINTQRYCSNISGTVNIPVKDFVPTVLTNDRIVVSDADSDDEESDSSSDSSRDDEDSDSDDSDSDDSDSDDEDEDEAVIITDNIRIINLEVNDHIDVAEINLDKQEAELEQENIVELEQVLEQEQELEKELEQELEQHNIVELNNIESDAIIVEKLNPTDSDNLTIVQNNDSQSAKDVYRKMSVNELRALVITKGLCSEPSKMKKPELLKLLDTTEE
jgi:hypothetical protein